MVDLDKYMDLLEASARLLGCMDLAIERGELPEYLLKHHKALEDVIFGETTGDTPEPEDVPLAPVYDISTGVMVGSKEISK